MKIRNLVIAGLAIAGLVYTFKDPYRKDVFKDAITSSKKMITKYAPASKEKIDEWKSIGLIEKIDYKTKKVYVKRELWDKPSFNDYEKFKLCRTVAVHIAQQNKSEDLMLLVYAKAKDNPVFVKVAKYNGSTGYKEDREKVDFGKLLNE